MALGGIYKDGTVSTDPGDARHLVFTDALLTTQGEVGDWILAGGVIGLIESVDDDSNITLAADWTGGALDDDEYLLLKTSWRRYDPALTQAKLREYLSEIDKEGRFLYVEGDAPSVADGVDGQYGLKVNDGPWQIWRKESGSWVSKGIPVGASVRGQWDSATEYFGNDLVEYGGSLWGALAGSTNVVPGTDDDAWQLAVLKGTDGKHGGAIAFTQVFSSSTSNSDPGAGMFRFNNATPASVTAARLDYLDDNGASVQLVLASLTYASTSAIKGQFRFVEIDDPARWIIFNVTALSDMTGYYNVVGTVLATSTNPIRDTRRCILFFTAKGDKGEQGNTGDGWAPVLAVVTDGARKVFRVTDWISGTGTKPAINKYVGASGLVDAIGDAIDVRGPIGLKGDRGLQGQGIDFDDSGTTANRSTHDGEAKGYVYIATDVVPNMIYIKNSNATADWSDGSPIGGAGDMLKSDNLSGLDDLPTARTNLGLGDLATKNQSDLVDPIGMAIIFGS